MGSVGVIETAHRPSGDNDCARPRPIFTAERAIGPLQENVVVGSGDVLAREQQRAAVARDVSRDGPTVPHELASRRTIAGHRYGCVTGLDAGQEHAASAVDVEQQQILRHVPDEAPGAGRRGIGVDRPERPRGLVRGGAVPDFAAIGRPRERFGAAVLGCQAPRFAAVVDIDIAAVVAEERVLDESNPLAIRRDSHAAQVARRLEDDVALRHFEAIAPIHAADDGELIARQEVGVAHALEDLAGARPEEPRPGESSLCCPRRVVAARKRQQHLARIRHGEDVTRW